MNKKLKRVLTMILALALCFALTCPTFAANSGIGVMWMGDYVKFTDAKPMLRDNRTMIPIRAFMEYTGAEVDYQAKTVILTTADATISFRPGELTAQVVRGGETSTIEMDVAPFIENSRTFVPLRFFGQALGYDVLWDSKDKTAVILDAKTIVPTLDKSFTVLNGLLGANAGDGSKALQSKANASCTMKMNGQSGSLTAAVNVLSKGTAADMTLSWNLNGMKDMLMGAALPVQITLENSGDVMAVAQSQAELILNAEEGKLYCKSPAFASLCRLLTGGALTMPANTWISADLGTSVSVGALIYQSCLDDSNGVKAYSGMNEKAAKLAALLGDGAFTASGSDKTLKSDIGPLLNVESAALKLTVGAAQQSSSAPRTAPPASAAVTDISALLGENFSLDSITGLLG